jgi:hypothetical protein
MQTKKRARSVTFGKKKEKPEDKISSEVVQEILANAAKASSSEEKADEVQEEMAEEKEQAPHVKEEPEEKVETAEVTEVEEPVVEVASVSEEQTGEANDETKDVKEENAETTAKEKSSLEASLDNLKSDSNTEDISNTSFFAQTPTSKPSSRKKKGHILYFFGVAFVSFLLGLVVMAGATYGIKSFPNSKTNWLAAAKPTPTPVISPEPTRTPEKKTDLSAFSIQILNGSGISGKAAKLKTLLEDAGFTVSSTGNADLNDYTKTQVRAKKNVGEDYLKKLEATLKKEYVLSSSPGLPPTGSADVIVIIGSESAN